MFDHKTLNEMGLLDSHTLFSFLKMSGGLLRDETNIIVEVRGYVYDKGRIWHTKLRDTHTLPHNHPLLYLLTCVIRHTLILNGDANWQHW